MKKTNIKESGNKVMTIMADEKVSRKLHQVRRLFSRITPNLDEVNEIKRFIDEYGKIALELEIEQIDAQIAALNEMKKILTK